MKNLKNCPFCGGDAELLKGEECAQVQCTKVKAHKMFYDGDNNAAEEVAEMWNRRDLEESLKQGMFSMAAEVCVCQSKLADALIVKNPTYEQLKDRLAELEAALENAQTKAFAAAVAAGKEREKNVRLVALIRDIYGYGLREVYNSRDERSVIRLEGRIQKELQHMEPKDAQ